MVVTMKDLLLAKEETTKEVREFILKNSKKKKAKAKKKQKPSKLEA